MGCVNSSENVPGIAERRRRLSVGEVKGGQEDIAPDILEELEEARGYLKEVNEKTLLEMISDDNTRSRKFSIGSDTDKDLNMRSSFASKTVTKEGDPQEQEHSNIGFACKKGLKPESPNQDSWSVLMVEQDFSVYGVFDGHGAKGHDVSNFVRMNFPKILVNSDSFREDPETALKDTYRRIQNMIEVQTKTGSLNATMSGTTTSVILHRHSDNKLFVSHVGDSRCVLAREGAKGAALALTNDHKPQDAIEKKRIESKGGRVVFDGFANFRVYAKGGAYPGLNMSRALGDLMGYYDAGISCEPSVSSITLEPEDTMILLCSDGVWEFIKDEEAVKLTLPLSHGPMKNPQQAAELLAKEAWDRWMVEESGLVVDDITVIVVALRNGDGQGNGVPGTHK